MKVKNSKKERNIIIILLVLLGISLCVLAGIIIYRYYAPNEPTSVVVAKNIITSDEEYSEIDSITEMNSNYETTQMDNLQSGTSTGSSSVEDKAKAAEVTLALHKKQLSDNKIFIVENMFPGDSETNYYRLNVTHKNDVTVHFHADIEKGYEKLSEVLKTKIVLITTDEVLYDGLMRDMPSSLDHRLTTDKPTTNELYYEITAYVDTTVGNEYMEKELKANFKWWVEDQEKDNLDSLQTGDKYSLTLWISLMCASLLVLLVFLKRRKKEEAYAKKK